MLRGHSAFLTRFAPLLGGWFAPVRGWRRAAIPVVVLAFLSLVACSDIPSDSEGPEPVSDPVEAVVQSNDAAEQAGPPATVVAPTPDDGRASTTTTLTHPTTAPSSEGEAIREGDSAPITEPDTEPGTRPPADDEEGVPAIVEDPGPDRADTPSDGERSNLWPATDILLSGSYRPDMDVRLDGGEIHATVNGSVGPNRRQFYTFHAADGQSFIASVDARQGVWIELWLGDEVIVSEDEQSQRVETTLGRGGPWRVVVSTGEGFHDYALTIRLIAPEPKAGGSGLAAGDVVYLTFDDGPDPRNTPHILDILARHGARATFFVVGKLVERHPDLFRRIVSEGHTVANHTWNHENLARLSRQEFDETIGRTQEILGENATACMRPPYAATNRNTRPWAAEHGLEVHLWSVSANDWLGLDAEEIADRIVGQVTDGSVVLMHDGGGNRPETVRGLEIVLERLSGLRLRYEPLCR